MTVCFDEDGRGPDVGERVGGGDDEVVPAFIRGRVAEEDVGADYVECAGVVADAVEFVSWDGNEEVRLVSEYVGAHCEMSVSIVIVVGWKTYESGGEATRLRPLAFGTDACFRLSQTQLSAQVIAIVDCVAYDVSISSTEPALLRSETKGRYR